MDQDIDKGFWIEGIMLPDKEGKVDGNHYAGYKGKLKVSLGKPKRESGKHGKHLMLFKTILPSHIYDLLSGRKIERSRGGLVSEVSTNYYNNLSKTITSNSLEGLVKRFDEIVQDFLFIIQDEQKPKEKLIFVNWKSNFNKNKISNQNSSKLGNKMSMEFHYFVGYYNGRSYYDMDHKGINVLSTSYESDVINYKKIPWTLEREEFFNYIFSNFEKFKNNIESFFENINPKTIDSHMSEFKMLN